MKPATSFRRRSLRIPGYNYRTPGAYVITLCTQDRICLFGEIRDGVMTLSRAGEMVQSVWTEMPAHYPGVEVDAFVVMPNHVHGIICLETGAQLSLPDAVHRLKSLTTARYRHGVEELGWPRFNGRLWQRNYFEHIVRIERALQTHRKYIAENPARWLNDRFYAGSPG